MSMVEANAQTQIIEKDIARLRDSMSEQSARFDRHLEIYAQNGKELAALKQEVRSNHQAMLKAVEGLAEKLTLSNSDHVTRNEFNPVKISVYGFIGLVLTAAIAAILSLILI